LWKATYTFSCQHKTQLDTVKEIGDYLLKNSRDNGDATLNKIIQDGLKQSQVDPNWAPTPSSNAILNLCLRDQTKIGWNQIYYGGRVAHQKSFGQKISHYKKPEIDSKPRKFFLSFFERWMCLSSERYRFSTEKILRPEKKPLYKTRNRFKTSQVFSIFFRKMDVSLFRKIPVLNRKNSGPLQNFPVPFPNFPTFPKNNRIHRKNIPDVPDIYFLLYLDQNWK
jgi:hypothetical protein